MDLFGLTFKVIARILRVTTLIKERISHDLKRYPHDDSERCYRPADFRQGGDLTFHLLFTKRDSLPIRVSTLSFLCKYKS
jgi:hypothetical protein